eukprot:GHVT01008371.1.p1 GENE.GHVT01008371.1~~GHVT01008371.1.p1  ORF type:complete len:1558 (+),score=146.75 GHVT01008371.1:1228-5901(+)
MEPDGAGHVPSGVTRLWKERRSYSGQSEACNTALLIGPTGGAQPDNRTQRTRRGSTADAKGGLLVVTNESPVTEGDNHSESPTLNGKEEVESSILFSQRVPLSRHLERSVGPSDLCPNIRPVSQAPQASGHQILKVGPGSTHAAIPESPQNNMIQSRTHFPDLDVRPNAKKDHRQKHADQEDGQYKAAGATLKKHIRRAGSSTNNSEVRSKPTFLRNQTCPSPVSRIHNDLSHVTGNAQRSAKNDFSGGTATDPRAYGQASTGVTARIVDCSSERFNLGQDHDGSANVCLNKHQREYGQPPSVHGGSQSGGHQGAPSELPGDVSLANGKLSSANTTAVVIQGKLNGGMKQPRGFSSRKSSETERTWKPEKGLVDNVERTSTVLSKSPSLDIRSESTIRDEIIAHNRREQRMLSAVFACFFTVAIAVNFDSGAIPAVLYELKNEFRMSDVQQGLLGALPYIGLVLGSPAGSRLLQRFSQRKFLICTLAANMLCTVGLATVRAPSIEGADTGVLWLFTVRLLIGISQAPFAIYAPVWVDEFAPENRVTIWMGLVQGGAVIGAVTGYLFAGVFRQMGINWRWAIVLQSSTLVLLILTIMMTPQRFIDIMEANHVSNAGEAEKDGSAGRHSNVAKRSLTPIDSAPKYGSLSPAAQPTETTSKETNSLTTISQTKNEPNERAPLILDQKGDRAANPSERSGVDTLCEIQNSKHLGRSDTGEKERNELCAVEDLSSVSAGQLVSDFASNNSTRSPRTVEDATSLKIFQGTRETHNEAAHSNLEKNEVPNLSELEDSGGQDIALTEEPSRTAALTSASPSTLRSVSSAASGSPAITLASLSALDPALEILHKKDLQPSQAESLPGAFFGLKPLNETSREWASSEISSSSLKFLSPQNSENDTFAGSQQTHSTSQEKRGQRVVPPLRLPHPHSNARNSGMEKSPRMSADRTHFPTSWRAWGQHRLNSISSPRSPFATPSGPTSSSPSPGSHGVIVHTEGGAKRRKSSSNSTTSLSVPREFGHPPTGNPGRPSSLMSDFTAVSMGFFHNGSAQGQNGADPRMSISPTSFAHMRSRAQQMQLTLATPAAGTARESNVGTPRKDDDSNRSSLDSSHQALRTRRATTEILAHGMVGASLLWPCPGSLLSTTIHAPVADDFSDSDESDSLGDAVLHPSSDAKFQGGTNSPRNDMSASLPSPRRFTPSIPKWLWGAAEYLSARPTTIPEESSQPGQPHGRPPADVFVGNEVGQSSLSDWANATDTFNKTISAQTGGCDQSSGPDVGKSENQEEFSQLRDPRQLPETPCPPTGAIPDDSNDKWITPSAEKTPSSEPAPILQDISALPAVTMTPQGLPMVDLLAATFELPESESCDSHENAHVADTFSQTATALNSAQLADINVSKTMTGVTAQRGRTENWSQEVTAIVPPAAGAAQGLDGVNVSVEKCAEEKSSQNAGPAQRPWDRLADSQMVKDITQHEDVPSFISLVNKTDTKCGADSSVSPQTIGQKSVDFPVAGKAAVKPEPKHPRNLGFGHSVCLLTKSPESSFGRPVTSRNTWRRTPQQCCSRSQR